ncbi:hypothetical protein WJX74_006154 [Apatococcus lobatus]|uniref:FAD/NAD(P)-binding domain-containing protein n=1 Tax=Apatococcus lobatus TaxID=904363 RepID=A0AAW1QCM2_9CHLO
MVLGESNTNKKSVVVLGGGSAGIAVAQALHETKSFSVTLVDRKAYHEIPWANVRAYTVDYSITAKSTVPWKDIPKLGEVTVGEVVSVAGGSVSLKSGLSVPYDYLVFAMGSHFREPLCKGLEGTAADRASEMQLANEKLKAAKSVLIVGGGAVGVEVAGEIASVLPDKQITLVHSKSQLLVDDKPRMSNNAVHWLKKHNVKLILDDKLDGSQQGPHYTTEKGVQIQADIVYWTVGLIPSTAFLKSENILDGKGFIKVDMHFRVEGHPNWFAVGDCNNIPEIKLGYLAQGQGKQLAQELKQLAVSDTFPGKIKPWKLQGGFRAMIISLGKDNGVGHIGPVPIWGWAPAKIKSGDLFISKTRKDIGLPA